MLLRGDRYGASLLVTPVNIVRYFEFAFASSQLPTTLKFSELLDVGSPRLFALWVAKTVPSARILMINPDVADATRTASAATRLGLHNVTVRPQYVEDLAGSAERFDAIWSLSVVEHIAGEEADRDAISLMYRCLRVGGRLILTMPVDRTPWTEYRQTDPYGLRGPNAKGEVFFQRWYDEDAIKRRLLRDVQGALVTMRWFGERQPGTYAAYEREWLARGHERTVDDPREIADRYAEYPSWSDMPGMGVAGVAVERVH